MYNLDCAFQDNMGSYLGFYKIIPISALWSIFLSVPDHNLKSGYGTDKQVYVNHVLVYFLNLN